MERRPFPQTVSYATYLSVFFLPFLVSSPSSPYLTPPYLISAQDSISMVPIFQSCPLVPAFERSCRSACAFVLAFLSRSYESSLTAAASLSTAYVKVGVFLPELRSAYYCRAQSYDFRAELDAHGAAARALRGAYQVLCKFALRRSRRASTRVIHA